ncbi:MAG: hypothetical protein JO029_16055 [Candidatus Eremiobacteraeota bacterium]|nr:hypothetical protein [Candidatus Eremiobacteraeota bacterium]
MMFRRIAFGISAVLFTACGQASSILQPASTVDVRPMAKGPVFSIAVQLPDGRTARATAKLGSLKAITFVGKTRYVDVVEAPVTGCTLTDTSGTATGCQVLVASNTPYAIKRSTFSFYKSPHARGCVLAEGTFKGTTYYLEQLPITFKIKKPCF